MLTLPLHGLILGGQKSGKSRLAEEQAAAWLAASPGHRATLAALGRAPGPVLWVSNEIGLGVSPPGREVRRFLDALGTLHQQVAALCGRVQLMVAGIPLTVKGTP